MMRRSKNLRAAGQPSEDPEASDYFIYRPLSNLPTPPPTASRSSSFAASPASVHDECDALDDRSLDPKYRGESSPLDRERIFASGCRVIPGSPAYSNRHISLTSLLPPPGPATHLVNLIPCAASLAEPSIALVQSILARAALPIQTVALAVCILDSLDARFARSWRLSCPSRLSNIRRSASKRHTLPPTPSDLGNHRHQVHVDSISPEIIAVAALVIAAKFTEDFQEPTKYYCHVWGRDLWSHEQLNATERCIMVALDYRIMPLCDDDCLTGAMVDMQLAARQTVKRPSVLTPPDSGATSEDEVAPMSLHQRSKTVGTVILGL